MKNKSVTRTLIKKQITEFFSFTKRDKKSIDVLGTILSVVLIGSLLTIFLLVFSRLIILYYDVPQDGELVHALRQRQLLSVAYFFVLLLGIFSSARNINHEIFETDDLNVLSALPISANQLFWAKMIVVYVKQIFVSFFTIFPINMAFVIAGPQPLSYYFLSVFVCLVFPMISILIASVVAMPFHYIKKFIGEKYILSFVLIIVFTLGACILYAGIVDRVKFLIINGDIKYAFNENTMRFIESLVTISYPTNFLVDILMRDQLWLNFLLIAGTLSVSAVISYFVIKAMLGRALKQNVFIHVRKDAQHKLHKLRPQWLTLLYKEFNNIFRTPSYTFQFFAMTIALPAMVFLCVSMGETFLKSLLFVGANKQLSLAIVLIFGVLTNTFCATNISRDGESFFTSKTLPVSIRQIVFSKVLLCMMNAIASTLLSVIMLTVMAYITVPQAIYIFFTAILFACAQICFATRLDFNKPRFPQTQDGVIKESSTTVSSVLVVGLISALAIGFGNVIMEVGSVFDFSLGIWPTVIAVLTVVIPAVLAVAGILFLNIHLEKRYKNFEGG